MMPGFQFTDSNEVDVEYFAIKSNIYWSIDVRSGPGHESVTGFRGTYLYSPYVGVPPPPPGLKRRPTIRYSTYSNQISTSLRFRSDNESAEGDL